MANVLCGSEINSGVWDSTSHVLWPESGSRNMCVCRTWNQRPLPSNAAARACKACKATAEQGAKLGVTSIGARVLAR